MRRRFYSFGLAGFVGWLLAVVAVLFDTSDPDAAPFSISCMNHDGATYWYFAHCGNGSAPQIDTWETIDLHFQQTLGWIDKSIARWRDEPILDFDWVKRRGMELDDRRRASRIVADVMNRPAIR